MNELLEWLDRNKIAYVAIDPEVVEIPDFGKVFYQDTSKQSSIFRTDKDENLAFNCVESPEVLMEEDINFVAFNFGDNWYYHDLRTDFQLNILKYVGQRIPTRKKASLVNLGVHTPYELLNGSFMPKMWVKKAVYCGHKAIGICDRNTMAACYNLQKECDAAGITPVFGYSLTFDDGGNRVEAKVYVQSQQGLRNLLRIQKAIMVDSEDKTIQLSELLGRGRGNVLVLGKHSSYWMAENPDVVSAMVSAFDHVFYQVDLSEYKAERIDIKALEATKKYFDVLYGVAGVSPILLCDCYYLDKDDAKNKIILNKIAAGAAHEQSEDQYFKDADEHYALFSQLFDGDKWDVDDIFRECCENATLVAEGTKARFENTRHFMPKYTMTAEETAKYGTAHNMFNELLEEGLVKLVPEEKRAHYRKQMEYEKYIIESTDNVDYLLVQYDTCNWSRRNGILVGCGRGSAAGSLLLYLLGITLIDPIKYELIFERFLLPERAGLYPSDTTIIGRDIETRDYVEVCLEGGKTLNIDRDARLLVRREEDVQPIEVYADELLSGDDILFDNRDQLFTINEL
jgi:DNA polymerase-3 subunit alpha